MISANPSIPVKLGKPSICTLILKIYDNIDRLISNIKFHCGVLQYIENKFQQIIDSHNKKVWKLPRNQKIIIKTV